MSLEDESTDPCDLVSTDAEAEADTSLASDSDNTPGSVVLVPEVERVVNNPNDRRGRLVVGHVLTLEDLGFQPHESEMSNEERFERMRDLVMFKHTLDMTISSLQVGFKVLVVS